MAMVKPSPSPPVSAPPMRLAAGTRTPSMMTCAVGWAFQPIFCSFGPKLKPGESAGTMNVEMPFGPGSPVRAMTT
jgi:hypothetical protein